MSPWSTPTPGWAFDDNATGGLYVTTDGGTTWTAQLVGQRVSSLATAGSSAWAVANQSCRGCTPRLFSIARPGAQPVLLPAQPPSGVDLVERLSPTTAIDLTHLPDSTKQGLAVTDDGGHSWALRPLPCAIAAEIDGEHPPIAYTSGGQLWLACPGRSLLADVTEAPQTVMTSTDLGRTWHPITPQFASTGEQLLLGFNDQVLSMTAASPTVLWVLEADAETTNGPVLRSTDGGRTWHQVLQRFLPGTTTPLDISALTVTGAATAWITGFASRNVDATVFHPVVLHTTDAGATWTVTHLPVP